MFDNVNECIEYLKEKSVLFYSIANDKQKTYKEINKLKYSSDLDKLLEFYKEHVGPLNILRLVVLEKIKEGVEITEDVVKEIKDKFNNKDLKYFKKYVAQDILDSIVNHKTAKGEDPFKSWKDPFRMFYVYFFNLKKEQIELCLNKIGQKLIEDLNLINYETELGNFDGVQHQGLDHCGLCLFPKELGEYKNAFQFSLDIINNQLFAGIYKGKEVIANENFENNRKECFDYSTILQTLKQYASKIIDLNNALIKNKKQNQSIFEKGKQYWIYAPGEHADRWEEYYNKNIMGIGWGFVGDIKKFDNRKEIDSKLKDNIQNSKSESHNNISKCLWDFANEMKVGDVVFVKKGVVSIIGRGIVTGDYIYDDTIKDEFKHIRTIKWTHKHEYECNKEDKLLNKKTLTNITNSTKSIEKLESFFNAIKQIDNNNVYKQGEKEMLPLNQILYGPPGTGKTYSTKKLIDDIIKDQTITKDDILINIIKDLNWYEIIALAIYLNTNKTKFSVKELSESEIIQLYYPTKEVKKKNLKPCLWGQLQRHTINECKNVKVAYKNEPLIFNKDNDSDWNLSSDGIDFVKTNLKEIISDITNINKIDDSINNKDKYCRFITFHQSYSYEEFIEGIKPVIDENTVSDEIKYEKAPGIFKELCLKANSDPKNNYVLVIDEINRGNISKIFGELITLIEDDKRVEPNGEDDFENTQVKDNELLVTLPYSKQKFGVPKNLYIIGTMNTSDRSIASVDIALRRRFKFIEMMPKKDLVADFGVGFDKIFEELNNKIRILLDRDHQIGHSYFINTKYNNDKGNNNIETLKGIWFSEILPLLNEYFYNDWDKLNLIVPGFITEVNVPESLQNECDKSYEFKTIDNFKNADDFKNALLRILE